MPPGVGKTYAMLEAAGLELKKGWGGDGLGFRIADE